MDAPLDVFRILQVALGIGLVIFVHELGHFLAARLCGVRVETFSLGFGPKIFGWRRGGTMYQIAFLPLGGFCRMAGEERRADGVPPAPDDLLAKGVGQRFFIYSGGVLMNVAFGLVVFPILFQVGVPFMRPLIGQTEPGGPAWHAGIPPGTEVLEVNGARVHDFQHVFTEVALGDPERTELLVRLPGNAREERFVLTPKRDETQGLRHIGIGPDLERDAENRIVLGVAEKSPAWEAGLRDGDRLIEVLNGRPGLSFPDQVMTLSQAGLPLAIRVAGETGARDLELPLVELEREGPMRVGIAAPVNHVVDVRASEAVRRLGIAPEDRILLAQGEPVLWPGDLARLLSESTGDLEIVVERAGRRVVLAHPALGESEALRLADDIALRSDVDTTRIVVQAGDPADRAGLRTGDRVLRIDDFEVGRWEQISAMVRSAAEEDRPARFVVERLDETGVEMTARIAVRASPAPLRSHGVILKPARYLYRSESFPEAVRFGMVSSWQYLRDTWLTIQAMAMRDVPMNSAGGIITISAVSYDLAALGWTKLFFFLCILSINLAVLNVLPIPVLDGGHLFFLIVEKLKGSPVSDRVLGYSQMVGVAMILSLLVYITYNDLVRWVFPA